MKNKELRLSVIKSGIILLIILACIWSIAGGSSGGLFAGIGSLITNLFSFVLFLLALFIGILFSVLVIVAIFFGAVYLYSSENAAEMYDQLLDTLTKQSKSFTLPAALSCKHYRSKDKNAEEVALLTKELSSLSAQQSGIRKDITGLANQLNTLQGTQTGLESTLKNSEDSLSSITASLESIENALTDKAPAELTDTVNTIKKETDSLNNSIQEVASRITIIEKNPLLDSDLSSQEENRQLEEIKEKINQIENKLTELNDAQAKQVVPEESTEAEESHRILNYFEKPERSKVAQLADETVEKEMTYAQAGKHLEANLNKKGKKIIKEHPSLTKDFIRSRRQKK